MKRIALLVTVGSIAFGLVFGSAASLSAPPSSLGVGVSTVSSCGTVSAVSYTTTYAASLVATGGFGVDSVTLSLTPTVAGSCDGKTVDIVLAGAAGASLGTGTATIAGPSAVSVTVAVAGPVGAKISAESVINTAIVIK